MSVLYTILAILCIPIMPYLAYNIVTRIFQDGRDLTQITAFEMLCLFGNLYWFTTSVLYLIDKLKNL